MSSLSSPVPVVLCGRTTTIGGQVAELLLPEYEVIYFLQEGTFDDAKSELKQVLAGREPQSSNENDVGTHNYSQPPRAVIFGRAFSLEQIREVKESFSDSSNEPVAWIVGDPAKAPTGPPGPGYAKVAADLVKNALEKWKEEGGVKDEIILY